MSCTRSSRPWRGGQGPYASFGKVILVGHSSGSGVIAIEANRYADVDGVVFTGYFHTFAPTASMMLSLWWPTANDPRFAHRHIPPGYTTTIPGTLATIAFYTPNLDPDVLAFAEAHIDLTPDGENYYPNILDPALVRGIHVPILSAVGQYDAAFCTPPSCPEAQAEPAFYACQSQGAGVKGIVATVCTPRSDLEVVVIPNAGHAFVLQRNAQQWFAIARTGTDCQFGPCPQGCEAPVVTAAPAANSTHPSALTAAGTADRVEERVHVRVVRAWSACTCQRRVEGRSGTQEQVHGANG